MQLSALQIVLLVLVAAEINVDRRGLSLTHARPVIVGFPVRTDLRRHEQRSLHRRYFHTDVLRCCRSWRFFCT